MGENPPTSRISLNVKLIGLIASIALITTILLLLFVFPWQNRSVFPKPHGWPTFVVIIVILFSVTFIGYRISRRYTRRLEHIFEVARAWLRGKLHVRIGEPNTDDLGLFAEDLDQLADHLEEDEQDLSRLSQSNTRLTDQVRALAVVEERNRLARELHDSVKQHLFSLAMTASAINTRFGTLENIPEDVKEMAVEIVNAAQNAQRETTRLIEDLRPGSLEEQGLISALNDYTLLFGAQEHLLIYLDVDCNDSQLPPPVSEALYRVTQESLHNIARHARATRVDVDLRCFDNRIVLQIEDNGVGFDTRNARQGLGISNMQERLLSIGGRLTIQSHKGIGTTVMAEVQFKEQPESYTKTEDIDSARTNIRNWLWLGQRLVVPVGQIWPWVPEEEQRYLSEPLVEADLSPLIIRKEKRIFAFRKLYTLKSAVQRKPICRFHREKAGYTWVSNDATWDLRQVRGLYGRSILLRKGQPLAALQYQGRQMNMWTEIVYRTQTFNLVYSRGERECYTLKDSLDQVYIDIQKTEMKITVHRPIPLQLLLITVTRFLDESAVSHPGRRNRTIKQSNSSLNTSIDEIHSSQNLLNSEKGAKES